MNEKISFKLKFLRLLLSILFTVVICFGYSSTVHATEPTDPPAGEEGGGEEGGEGEDEEEDEEDEDEEEDDVELEESIAPEGSAEIIEHTEIQVNEETGVEEEVNLIPEDEIPTFENDPPATTTTTVVQEQIPVTTPGTDQGTGGRSESEYPLPYPDRQPHIRETQSGSESQAEERSPVQLSY